jgi:1-acyl-sn-glycerol-3-phosphate acyltransferase
VGLVIVVGLCAALLFPLLSPRARAWSRGRWSRALLAALGVQLHIRGGEHGSGGALIVANHVSWLDVMAINAVFPQAAFVCKDDVASWPVFGWLLRRTGTYFIRRRSAHDARRAGRRMTEDLRQGACIAFFPEGTTTAGREVLPFRPGLFEAAVQSGCAIQPVALAYSSGAAVYAGDTSFGKSLGAICDARGLAVTLSLPRVFSAAGLDRRAAAGEARRRIASRLGHAAVAEPSRREPILRAA